MANILLTYNSQAFEIPNWVQDFDSFRRWADEDGFPHKGRVHFIDGDIYVEMEMEQLFTHNDIKAELTLVLRTLARERVRGRYFTDGAYLSNEGANISNQPDGCFALTSTLESGKLTIRMGSEDGHVELMGSPDLVIEVVSPSSIAKDTVKLRAIYARGGIDEYWIIDARKPPLSFDVLKLGKSGYSVSRKLHGWSFSEVFDRWFRLNQIQGEGGYPYFSLDICEERPKR